MIRDIEGCRTWVSDKTLINLAEALKTDIYRLFLPDSAFDEEIFKKARNDLDIITKKIRKDVDANLINAMKLWEKSIN